MREYYGTLGYEWVVSRQVDRVMEAYSRIDPLAPVPGILRTYFAARALIVLVSPFIEVDKPARRLGGFNGLVRDSPGEALRILDQVLADVLGDLEEKGLLVRASDLLSGKAEV